MQQIPLTIAYGDLVKVVIEQQRQIEALKAALKPASSGWTLPSNLTIQRGSYDANATTTAELADVLGTLISDLKTQQLLK